MTHPFRSILVTGAGGYVGEALVSRIGAIRRQSPFTDAALVVVDRHIPDGQRLPGVRWIEGDLADPEVLTASTCDRPDLVFHLAGITSGRAEADFAAGLRANVQTTIALLEQLRMQGTCPSFVFLSSIAVFGAPLPARIDDETPALPALSYGAQKLAVEILLADYARRGWIEGLSLRLSSIVARPCATENALSAFASALIREPAEGRRHTCPVGADATILWQSLPTCVDNLVHAARLLHRRHSREEPGRPGLPQTRAITLPALRASAGDVLAALVRKYGAPLQQLVEFKPDLKLCGQFDRWPPLAAATAERLGFSRDVDLDSLISEAVRLT